MVLGVQRSGTSALFNSLANDKSLSAYSEDIDNAFYYHYRLRPQRDIAHLLEAAAGRVLLKPICETIDRALTELSEEYRAYSPRFVWIYRDPVNVLHSMRRQGWIGTEEVDLSCHALAWGRRNEYALQFQRQNPEQIAIVRYEDLSADPLVFRQLTDWLDVRSRSSFRPDSDNGRRRLPTAAQKRIDATTGETLRALDAARTFKPRALHRWKADVLRKLNYQIKIKRLRGGAGVTGPNGFDWNDVALSEPALIPSSLQDLHFWLDPSERAFLNAREECTEILDLGPHHLLAFIPPNGPYHVVSLNGKATLFYPHSQVESRRHDSSGILTFAANHDWSFLFDGGSFTLFALFRPNVPCYRPYNQQQSELLQIAPKKERGSRFLLGWDGHMGATHVNITCASQDEPLTASTPVQSHPRQEWRIISVHYSGDEGSELAIFTNGVPGASNAARPASHCASSVSDEYVMELGGCEGNRDRLFYGNVAEIIIFKRALKNGERQGLTRYLKEKYQL